MVEIPCQCGIETWVSFAKELISHVFAKCEKKSVYQVKLVLN